MNQNITIRSCQTKDLEQILILDKSSFGQLWSKSQYEREINLPNSHFSLLSINNQKSSEAEIIGMGSWRVIAQDVEIPLFAIVPAYQTQGFGSYFFAHLLQEIVKDNLRQARLDVNVNNQKAIALYQKFGFKIFARIKHFYKKQQEDAYRMMLPSLTDKFFQQQLKINYQQAYQRLQTKGFALLSPVE